MLNLFNINTVILVQGRCVNDVIPSHYGYTVMVQFQWHSSNRMEADRPSMLFNGGFRTKEISTDVAMLDEAFVVYVLLKTAMKRCRRARKLNGRGQRWLPCVQYKYKIR